MPKYIDVESTAYDYKTLADWLISSVGPEPPVWTKVHIDELMEDFYVVPKYPGAAIVKPLVQCKECSIGKADAHDTNFFWCKLHGEYHFGDYFCADGKHKDGGQDE